MVRDAPAQRHDVHASSTSWTSLCQCPARAAIQLALRVCTWVGGALTLPLRLLPGNIDRCRTLYEKYLEWAPSNCAAWIKFAELEKMLGEADRARAIYELAISQPLLDMPEALWKSYIDFEIE